MCRDRSLNYEQNWCRERCRRLIYSDKKSSFDELLDMDGTVFIRHQNIQRLYI